MAVTFACDPIVGVVAHRSSSGVADRISQYVKRCGRNRREQASEAQSSSWPSAGAPHVVIVGGGFGGLYAARALARHPVRITLARQQNLSPVSALALSSGDRGPVGGRHCQAYPLHCAAQHAHARVVGGSAVSQSVRAHAATSQRERTRVRLSGPGDRSESHLLRPPGNGNCSRRAKTLEDALEIRRRVLLALEAAEQEEDISERRALLTFVIVGGGPTGVELAGAIAEITRHTVRYDFRAADPSQARVILLDAGPRFLPSYPADLSARAEEQLWGWRRGSEERRRHIGHSPRCARWRRGNYHAHSALGSRVGRRRSVHSLGHRWTAAEGYLSTRT